MSERVVRRALAVVAVLGLVLLLVTGHQMRKAATVEQAGNAALKAARTSVPAILSYTDSNLSTQLTSNKRLMTPAYAKRYTAMVRKRVLPQVRRFGVANQVGVVASGIVRSTENTAVILVFANQTTRTKERPDGITQGSRLEVTLRQQDDRWLVDDLRPL